MLLNVNVKKELCQRHQHVSIDESMVKNETKYNISRRYIKVKPIKWGMKFWVLADSLINGYTYDLDLYLWNQSAISTFGLRCDAVMKSDESLFNQGYRCVYEYFLYKWYIIYLFTYWTNVLDCVEQCC